MEIERKFIVDDESWRGRVAKVTNIRQAYICCTPESSVRVRVCEGGDARLTIKSSLSGFSRSEYEYPIPLDEAEELMQLRQGAVIEKARHDVYVEGSKWEIDVFAGENRGLVIAEIELESEDQTFARPDWAGREVTHDRRFYSSELAQHPYRRWADPVPAPLHTGSAVRMPGRLIDATYIAEPEG